MLSAAYNELAKVKRNFQEQQDSTKVDIQLGSNHDGTTVDASNVPVGNSEGVNASAREPESPAAPDVPHPLEPTALVLPGLYEVRLTTQTIRTRSAHTYSLTHCSLSQIFISMI